jgi:hypothetical protein
VLYSSILSIFNYSSQVELSPVLDAFKGNKSFVLHADGLYPSGNNSNECEEEVEDSGEELDAYYMAGPDEHETDEQFQAALAEQTDFEGFSDSSPNKESSGDEDEDEEIWETSEKSS